MLCGTGEGGGMIWSVSCPMCGGLGGIPFGIGFGKFGAYEQCWNCQGAGRIYGKSAPLEPDDIDALYDDAKHNGGEGG